MAALQKIRSKSGLLVGIIAVGLLAFVFPWGEVGTFINKMRDKAFVVDGTVVTTKEYSDKIAEWESFQKIMSNQNSLDEFTTSQIREMAYQQMVKEKMLDEEADKLGLAVTSEELNDMVYGNTVAPILYQIPFFVNPETRQFDKAYLMQFLSDINQDPGALQEPARSEIMARRQIWAFIQNMMKYQRLEEKYASLVAGSVLVSDTEAKAAYEDSKNVANIAYAVQRYTTMTDSTVQVSDKEIKDLYDLRKNNYKLDTELRKVSYFIKDVIPSDEDYAAIEEEMNKAYEKLKTSDNTAAVLSEYSSNYVDAFMAVSGLPADAKNFVQSASVNDIYGPVREGQSYIMYKLMDRTNAADSIKLQIIPLPQGLDAKTSAHIADSLQAVIKGGKDFGTVADEVLPGSNGGELGWVNEMMLASAGIAKECFAAAKGQVLKLNISGQTQLVRIADKTNPVPKVKLAVIEMPVIISDKTQNGIDNELNQFVSENGNLDNFDEAAQAKGYGIMSNAVISPSEMALGQATGTRQVIHWAFNEKVGSVKKFDMSDKRVVAIVKKEITGDYMPVSEVASALKQELLNDKKAEKMIADLKSKNISSLDAYAQAMGGKVDTVNFVTFQTNNLSGVGFEPMMNVYSKLAQVNKLEGPVKGKAGVYVMDVTSKTEDNKEFNEEQTKQTLKQSSFYQLMSQAVAVLKNKMKVEDNRVRFW
ncbi:peptidylprolyl isomerase [Prevotella sp. 10(H)]|uniref:peptidylprolyl isomerase n=1 Tax=Prevotella sp. 10(H) TaxID=1158294 RepID=UPI0004A703A1|nr:peptidylprolyl isomerase [Prevotella sp. 10(H)]